MFLNRRQLLARAGQFSTLTLATSLPDRVSAQGRPVTLIVSASPGGALDTVARRYAEALREPLGRTVIVENKPGAGGQLALSALKQAPADGQTFALIPPSPFTVFPSTYAKLPYDANADFTPIGTACSFDFGFAVAAQHPSRTIKDFGHWCKANPRLASVAVFGLGSTPHFLAWELAQKLGIELEPVPYKGTAAMAQDTAGGQVTSTIASTGNFAALHKGGKLRLLATTGTQRNVQVPDVPTFTEIGMPDLQVEEWYGFFARAATPTEDLARLSSAVQSALSKDEMRGALGALGFQSTYKGGPQLAQMIRNDQARWAEVVRRTGFRAQD